MQYEDGEDAKQRIVSRHKLVKMHVIVDAGGKRIVSCEVTRGTAHDSSRFRQMLAMVPDGTGCVMLDAGYDAIRNYKMIRYAGRKPMISTRKNHVARGLHVVGANFSSTALELRYAARICDHRRDCLLYVWKARLLVGLLLCRL